MSIHLVSQCRTQVVVDYKNQINSIINRKGFTKKPLLTSVLIVKQCFDQLLSQDGRWSADNRRQMDPFRDIDCYNPSPYRIVSFPSQLNFSFISLNDSRFSVHFHINDRILCCQSHSYDLYPGTYWGQGVLHVQGWMGGWGGAFLGSHYIAAGRRGILGTSKRSLVRSRLLGYVEVTLFTIKNKCYQTH